MKPVVLCYSSLNWVRQIVILELGAVILRLLGKIWKFVWKWSQCQRQQSCRGRKWDRWFWWCPLSPGSCTADPDSQLVDWDGCSGFTCDEEFCMRRKQYVFSFPIIHRQTHSVPGRTDIHTYKWGIQKDKIKVPKRTKVSNSSLNKYIIRRLWNLRVWK